MRKTYLKFTCSRCGKTEVFSPSPSKGLFHPSGWVENFLNRSNTDLCPECAVKFKTWLNDFLDGKDKTERNTLSVPTAKGTIKAKVTPDPNHPGILCVLHTLNGDPGVMMEYDPEEKDIVIRVWGEDKPDGDPTYVTRIDWSQQS